MLTVIMIILDVVVLGLLAIDYMDTSEYLEEQERMKDELMTLEEKVGSLEETVNYLMNKKDSKRKGHAGIAQR